jgi:NAD(P)H dehydrogenase (quinone)
LDIDPTCRTNKLSRRNSIYNTPGIAVIGLGLAFLEPEGTFVKHQEKEGNHMEVLIVYYSTYGHVHKMAEAIAEGVGEVDGAQAVTRRVPETLSDEVLEKLGAVDAQQAMSHVPICTVEELASADAVIFGTPTRFGNMCGQMRQFLDATGQLWAQGALVGKVGSVFTSSATQHGGQESTILSFHITLLHHGFVVVGLPYAFQGQMRIDEITGGSPYGASTIAGGSGERMPSENELDAARFQGKHVAEIASKLKG